jgi:putative transposase
VLLKQIRASYAQSRQTYGALRIHADLAEAGVRCGHKQVARLMRAAGLVDCHRRRAVRTTRWEPDVPVAPDRVNRHFGASAPNRLWTAENNHVPTWAGFRYLTVVLDVFSRRIVGRAMADHLRTELVLSALEMALRRRPAWGVIHHSDQGCQYTATSFGQRCQAAGVMPSMGLRGDCVDNAITAAFFATLECELLARHIFRTQAEARTALFDYIEGFYNPHRRHSALDYLSPAAHERFSQTVLSIGDSGMSEHRRRRGCGHVDRGVGAPLSICPHSITERRYRYPVIHCPRNRGNSSAPIWAKPVRVPVPMSCVPVTMSAVPSPLSLTQA